MFGYAPDGFRPDRGECFLPEKVKFRADYGHLGVFKGPKRAKKAISEKSSRPGARLQKCVKNGFFLAKMGGKTLLDDSLTDP